MRAKLHANASTWKEAKYWEGYSHESMQRKREKVEIWGLAPKIVLRSHPPERQKMLFYQTGYKLFSSLRFMMR